jgi:hypothetical protein
MPETTPNGSSSGEPFFFEAPELDFDRFDFFFFFFSDGRKQDLIDGFFARYVDGALRRAARVIHRDAVWRGFEGHFQF